MGITATTTVAGWRTTAGSTTVFLAREQNGWRVSAGQETNNLPDTVTEADAIAIVEAYAVLLETAVAADQAARVSKAQAKAYIAAPTTDRLGIEP
jgi:hypothetical protein